MYFYVYLCVCVCVGIRGVCTHKCVSVCDCLSEYGVPMSTYTCVSYVSVCTHMRLCVTM